MDVRERPTADRVAALRLALYRPDPPHGAVDAYLEAVGTLPPPVPIPEPLVTAPRVSRRARLVLGAAAAVVLVLLAVALRVVSSAPGAASAPVVLPAGFPPAVGDALGVLSGGPATSRAVDAGGRRVVVSVLCERSGTLALRIGAEPTVVLTCQVGAPALAFVPSSAPHGRVAVAVAPDGPVRWSATVAAETERAA